MTAQNYTKKKGGAFLRKVKTTEFVSSFFPSYFFLSFYFWIFSSNADKKNNYTFYTHMVKCFVMQEPTQLFLFFFFFLFSFSFQTPRIPHNLSNLSFLPSPPPPFFFKSCNAHFLLSSSLYNAPSQNGGLVLYMVWWLEGVCVCQCLVNIDKRSKKKKKKALR